MRVRVVRPEFWSDSKMAALPIPVRMTYIGLWQIADDAGYLEWDAKAIAAELYRYESPRRRETMVVDHLDRLLEASRIRLLPCRRHAVIPSLPQHRIKGGVLLFTVQKKHDFGCATSGSVDILSATSGSVSDSVSDSDSGSLARAREDGLPHIDEATAKLIEELTGRTVLQGGAKQLTELDRLIEDHGPEAVQAALRRVAEGHEHLTARQLVWPAMKLLEPMPDGKELAKAEHSAETGKREDRILESMWRARILEDYRWTGYWEPSWPPIAKVAARYGIAVPERPDAGASA